MPCALVLLLVWMGGRGAEPCCGGIVVAGLVGRGAGSGGAEGCEADGALVEAWLGEDEALGDGRAQWEGD